MDTDAISRALPRNHRRRRRYAGSTASSRSCSIPVTSSCQPPRSATVGARHSWVTVAGAAAAVEQQNQ